MHVGDTVHDCLFDLLLFADGLCHGLFALEARC
jgi:hypothetical protein